MKIAFGIIFGALVVVCMGVLADMPIMTVVAAVIGVLATALARAWKNHDDDIVRTLSDRLVKEEERASGEAERVKGLSAEVEKLREAAWNKEKEEHKQNIKNAEILISLIHRLFRTKEEDLHETRLAARDVRHELAKLLFLRIADRTFLKKSEFTSFLVSLRTNDGDVSYEGPPKETIHQTVKECQIFDSVDDKKPWVMELMSFMVKFK